MISEDAFAAVLARTRPGWRKSECVMRGYDCPICGKQERWSKWSGWTPCACPGEPRRITTEEHHDDRS